ncbi:DUF1810 domain-containing protein [Pedobacter frigoris]|uniref:DUF1810 domain-containing protein n=1 Tax=Pedobacter frigoris TaxID=2571272 RepID=UPI00292E9D46|nr:DUF1810 domain-containing protein [Pedobacter frigoris]
MDTTDVHGLGRFVMAQETDYETALTEVSYGKKKTHWMWYIFPQIQGLGFSESAKHYGIKDLDEATKYYAHPVLGPRLITISKEVLNHTDLTVRDMFGSPDDLKLRSCMTLFAAVPGADPVFQKVINQFFDGEKDQRTQRILGLQAYGS